MIPDRKHAEALRAADKERLYTLFAVATSISLFVFHELGRRQAIGERHEEERREWVDTRLGELAEGEVGHRERTRGVQNVGRVLIGAATITVAVVALVGLFASHTI
jgi:hypothetical protein